MTTLWKSCGQSISLPLSLPFIHEGDVSRTDPGSSTGRTLLTVRVLRKGVTPRTHCAELLEHNGRKLFWRKWCDGPALHPVTAVKSDLWKWKVGLKKVKYNLLYWCRRTQSLWCIWNEGTAHLNVFAWWLFCQQSLFVPVFVCQS